MKLGGARSQSMLKEETVFSKICDTTMNQKQNAIREHSEKKEEL